MMRSLAVAILLGVYFAGPTCMAATSTLESGSASGSASGSSASSSSLTRDELLARLAGDGEWTIHAGETVVIDGIAIATPTDFVVEAGGALVIRASDVCMTGGNHHGNYIRVFGALTIEGSHIWADPPAAVPSITAASPDAAIEVKGSALEGCYVSLDDGGHVTLSEASMDGLSFAVTARGVANGATLSASGCSVTGEWALRFGDIGGELELGHLVPGLTASHFQYGAALIDLEDCVLPPPLVQNSGGGQYGHLGIRVYNSQLLTAVSWEGGDLTLEHCQVCKLAIRNLLSAEYSGLHDGYFADETIVDQPTRKIHLIDSSIGGCSSNSLWSYCSTGSQIAHGITLTSQQEADLSVGDSTICGELKVGHNLMARNTAVGELQIYQATGSLMFENCSAQAVSVIISADVTIRGSLQITSDSVYDWGGWTSFSITRYFPIEVLNAEQQGLPDTVVELLDSDQHLLLQLHTGANGDCEVSIHFTKETYGKTYSLRVPSLGLTVPLRLTSSTPLRLIPVPTTHASTPQTIGIPTAIQSASTTQQVTLPDVAWPAWVTIPALKSDPTDSGVLPERDILSVQCAQNATYLFLRLGLGGPPNGSGQSRYLLGIWADASRQVCYRFTLDSGLAYDVRSRAGRQAGSRSLSGGGKLP